MPVSRSQLIFHEIKSDFASPHCTSTCRIATSLMTVKFGTSRSTMRIVTNYGMPVRWSTAHYRFSRAPCTATLYAPFVSCSLVHLVLSLFFAVDLSPELRSLFHQPSSLFALSLCHSHSLSFVRLLLLTRTYSSSRVLRPDGDRNGMSFLVSHIPSPSSCDNRVLSLCLSSLLSPSSTPNVPPTIALSPSGSVSLHLSTILVLSLPLDLFSPSFPRYDFSAPPIERSSNSTTCRQIKYVFARSAHHIWGARADKTIRARKRKELFVMTRKKGRDEIGNIERGEEAKVQVGTDKKVGKREAWKGRTLCAIVAAKSETKRNERCWDRSEEGERAAKGGGYA